MKKLVLFIVVSILIYTRFIGINWGLPYPMHPDERNMAVSITQLKCNFNDNEFKISNCLNPNFYAYGQLPLYIGFFLIKASQIIALQPYAEVTYNEAILSLRFISAISSVITAFFMIKILNLIISPQVKSYIKKGFREYLIWLVIIFSPYFIQFSHFGTTESILMLLYIIVIFYSLKLLSDKESKRNYILIGLTLGIASGIKLSALLFGIVPFLVWLKHIRESISLSLGEVKLLSKDNRRYKKVMLKIRLYKKRLLLLFKLIVKNTLDLKLKGFLLFILFIFGYLFTSPHNILNINSFLSSMQYESGVALGSIKVFYTRSFEYSIPTWFQLVKIFPFTFGLPFYLVIILGFLLLSWKNKKINLLRFAFLVYFLPTGFMYAKWTRFMSPVMPIGTLLGMILIVNTIYKFRSKDSYDVRDKIYLNPKNIKFFLIKIIVIFLIILPGLAYTSIYLNSDVRFRASDWLYQRVEAGKRLFYETANVVDVPIPDPKNTGSSFQDKQYLTNSFNFYDVDQEETLKNEFWRGIDEADYIIVPSRRVFKNHLCFSPCDDTDLKCQNLEKLKSVINGYLPSRCDSLKKEYPVLFDYYDKLWSGKLGFVKQEQFSSFPRLDLFGKTLLSLPDEFAEETWTVFDHPVIRIYKRSKI